VAVLDETEQEVEPLGPVEATTERSLPVFRAVKGTADKCIFKGTFCEHKVLCNYWRFVLICFFFVIRVIPLINFTHLLIDDIICLLVSKRLFFEQIIACHTLKEV
jgi:hypothetical protein